MSELVGSAVEQGSLAVERLQKEIARRPFALLEATPPVADLARGVHLLYDLSLTTTHGLIRAAARTSAGVAGVVLDALER